MAEAEPELHELADGLWAWRQSHPEWIPGRGWDPPVNSFLAVVPRGSDPGRVPPGRVEGLTLARDVALLIDALVLADWPWLDEQLVDKEVHVVQLKPDHNRSRDALAGRYGARVWRPGSYWPGDDVAGVATAKFDGRFKGETPLWIPAHGALIFADAVVADRAGNLRIWETDWYDEYTIPAMRRLLELPVERVLVSHGSPIEHPRDELERALSRPQWADY